MTNDLLVLVDDSEAAMPAVRWASSEAEMTGTGLHILAVHEDTPTLLSWTVPDESGPETVRYLYTRLEEAQLVARRVIDPELRDAMAIDTELARGDTTNILLERSASAEMIVVPGTGFSLHDPMSPYARLLSRSSCPVVVVDEDAGDGLSPLGAQIVVGVDGSTASTAAIARAFVEADRRGALLHAVHVWDVDHHASVFADGASAGADQTAERAVVAEALAGYRQDFPDVPTVMSTVYDDPVECLTRMSMRADLMIVGSRERSRWAAALTGSTGRELSMVAGCPVMVVRPEHDRVAHPPAPESRHRSSVLDAVLGWRRRHAVGTGSVS